MNPFARFEQQFAVILNVETLALDQPLHAYEEWDSLSRLTVVALVQRMFGVAIASDDFRRIETVRDLEEFVRVRDRRCA